MQNVAGATGAFATMDKIKADRAWSTIPAIKNNRVYANPVGTFLWSRYSCEEALQVLWVAKTLYPDLFQDVDMVKEVREFYKKFYNYDLSVENAQRILSAQDPQ
jgi:iron complex transport system substrate-binding protein